MRRTIDPISTVKLNSGAVRVPSEAIKSQSQTRSPQPPEVPETHDYAVMFKIKYQTNYGESLCVVGSNEQLGLWKNYKCHLKWTEGHVWISERPLFLKSTDAIFEYKYCLLWEDDQRLLNFEKGVERIADLAILPVVHPNDAEYARILNDESHQEGK